MQEAEASYKELKKEHEDVNKKLADKTAAHKSLLEEHAKINKAHQEAVQESVTARMSMRKLEEALAKKTSEAVAEQSKAAESSRLLSSLRRDFNESSLKSAYLGPCCYCNCFAASRWSGVRFVVHLQCLTLLQ